MICIHCLPASEPLGPEATMIALRDREAVARVATPSCAPSSSSAPRPPSPR